jgi:hypothetical protein
MVWRWVAEAKILAAVAPRAKKIDERASNAECGKARRPVMDFVQARELIRVRHELRELLAQNRREEARPLLERLRALAEADEAERAVIEPEIARWECGFAF